MRLQPDFLNTHRNLEVTLGCFSHLILPENVSAFNPYHLSTTATATSPGSACQSPSVTRNATGPLQPEPCPVALTMLICIFQGQESLSGLGRGCLLALVSSNRMCIFDSKHSFLKIFFAFLSSFHSPYIILVLDLCIVCMELGHYYKHS